MYFRDRSALIWTLFFPFVIIAIFGVLDFAKFSTAKVGLVYSEETEEYAKGVGEALSGIGDQYKIERSTSLDDEKKALVEDDRLIVLEFVTMQIPPEAPMQTPKVEIKAYLNKSNEQAAQGAFLIVQKVLSDFEMKMQQVQPVFDVNSQVVNVNNLRSIDFMVPGVVAMALMQGGLFGVIGTIVTYREKGILKRLFATPLRKSTFLIAKILSRLIISILQVIILLASSAIVFKINIVGSLILVFAIAIMGSITFLSLGFAISGIAKSTESARAIIMPIQMIMMFTSGVYFPRDVLPGWLYDITAFAPLTYFADALRDVMIRGHDLMENNVRTAVIGLSVWLILFVILAIRSFKWEKDG